MNRHPLVLGDLLDHVDDEAIDLALGHVRDRKRKLEGRNTTPQGE
jgi:hypothetical protein